MGKSEKYVQYNEDRKKKGLPPVTYEEWRKEQHDETLVYRSIEYLDLNRQGPNWGTRNKNELMKRTLYYLSGWKSGTYDSWISKLSTRLCLAPRTVRENYIDPLIVEGIIQRISSKVHFVGPPKASDDIPE